MSELLYQTNSYLKEFDAMVTDVNGDRVPDVVISNKRGVFVFIQVRRKE